VVLFSFSPRGFFVFVVWFASFFSFFVFFFSRILSGWPLLPRRVLLFPVSVAFFVGLSSVSCAFFRFLFQCLVAECSARAPCVWLLFAVAVCFMVLGVRSLLPGFDFVCLLYGV